MPTVDLASQLVLAVAERKVSRYHPGFPIGRGKLEALAVIACGERNVVEGSCSCDALCFCCWWGWLGLDSCCF